MKTYIDAENAKSYIYGQFVDRFPQFTLHAIIEGVDDIEPADVAPVVHAHWRLVSLNLWDCTNCHYVVDRWDRKTLYCPDCGARMDGEKE